MVTHTSPAPSATCERAAPEYRAPGDRPTKIRTGSDGHPVDERWVSERPTVPAAECPLEAFSRAWHADDPRARELFTLRYAQMASDADVRGLGERILREQLAMRPISDGLLELLRAEVLP